MADRGRAMVAASLSLAFIACLVAGCGSGNATPTATSPADAAPAASTNPPGGTASPTEPPPSGGLQPPLVVDQTLLDVLPESVAGIAVLPATETANGLAGDPALGRSAAAVAMAIALDGDDPNGQFAVATVVRLRPGVGGDAFWEQWQADYDEAACEPAGGIDRHDQTTIGGHDVRIAVCAAGAQTYHERLADGLLVSVTSVGDQGLGEQMMAGLRR